MKNYIGSSLRKKGKKFTVLVINSKMFLYLRNNTEGLGEAEKV